MTFFRLATLLEKGLYRRCFLMSFMKFFTEDLRKSASDLLLVQSQSWRLQNKFSWRFQVFLLLALSNIPRRYLLVQSQQWKLQNNMQRLFKGNNKDTRTKSVTSFLCLYCKSLNLFIHCSSISIVDIEQVNISWVNTGSKLVTSFLCLYW